MRKKVLASGAVLVLGLFVAWTMSAEAAPGDSFTVDPHQLTPTAAVVPAKVNPANGTDTILITYTDTANTANLSLDLRFYTDTCAKGLDVPITLTKGDIFIGDTGAGNLTALSRLSVSDLFLATGNGVILATTGAGNTQTFQLSSLIIDLNTGFGTTYERTGLPALKTPGSLAWAGFTTREFVEWYLTPSTGATTNTQFLCPRDGASGIGLATDMNAVAAMSTGTGTTTLTGEVLDGDENVINSLPTSCTCFTENPGSIKTIMALNPDPVGVFHFAPASGRDVVGWRLITFGPVTTQGAVSINLTFDTRMRRSTSP